MKKFGKILGGICVTVALCGAGLWSVTSSYAADDGDCKGTRCPATNKAGTDGLSFKELGI